MTVEQFNKLTGRAVIWNWVFGWSETVEVVISVWSCRKSTPKIVDRLILILLRVQSIWCRMPYIKAGSFNRLPSSEVCHLAVHPSTITSRHLLDHNAVTHLAVRGIFDPKWTQNCTSSWQIGGFGCQFVRDLIDQGFKSNHVGKQLALVPNVCRPLASLVYLLVISSRTKIMLSAKVDAYEVNGHHEFFHGDFFLSAKVMKMSDQTRHYFPQTWRGLGSRSIDNMVREIRIEPVICYIRGSVGRHVAGSAVME